MTVRAGSEFLVGRVAVYSVIYLTGVEVKIDIYIDFDTALLLDLIKNRVIKISIINNYD
jgi:hypothetical protein